MYRKSSPEAGSGPRWIGDTQLTGAAEPLHLAQELLLASQVRFDLLPLRDLVPQLHIGAFQGGSSPRFDRCRDQRCGEDDDHRDADREAESIEMERDQRRCHREHGQDDHDAVPRGLLRRSALHAIPPRFTAWDHTGTSAAKTSGSL